METIHARVLGILLYPLLHNLHADQGKAGIEPGSQLVGEHLTENSHTRSSLVSENGLFRTFHA